MPKGKQVLALKSSNHVYGTAKVGEKGQIVIPKEARDLFNINSGDNLLIMGDESVGIVITKLENLDEFAKKIIEKVKI